MLNTKPHAFFNTLFTGSDNTILPYCADITSEKHYSDALQ